MQISVKEVDWILTDGAGYTVSGVSGFGLAAITYSPGKGKPENRRLGDRTPPIAVPDSSIRCM